MASPPTVLVVDDNPAVATALEVLLSLHELRAVTVSSPEAALERLDEEPVDLVIQDMNFRADTTSGEEGVDVATRGGIDLVLMYLQLPGIDGTEAMHRIRAHPGNGKLPVVTVTAFGMRTDREQVSSSAFDGYIEWDDLHFDGWLPAKAEEQEAAVYLH